MLLRLDPRGARRCVAEIQETADLIAHLSQCFVVVLRDAARQRDLFLSSHDILSSVPRATPREGKDPAGQLCPKAERGRVLALLHQHGRTTIAFSSLGPGYRYAFYGDDALLAFVDTGRAWVAAGGPIAPRERLGEVSDAFVNEARRTGRRAVFVATEEIFRESAPGMANLLIGEQPVWDPHHWPETLRGARSLREQIRRARAKGIAVERLDQSALVAGAVSRLAADALIGRWLGNRVMAPLGFVVQVDPFMAPAECRYYGAWRGEALLGFLAMVPVFGRGGWCFEHMLRDPAAPNGTVELLIDAAMRDLKDEGVAYATLGLAPLSGPVAPWLRQAGSWGRPLYDFVGLRAFKQKLRPAGWAPVYLSYPRGDSSWLAIWDALSALSRGSLVRFGVATILRGPDIVIRTMTVLLVPWTVLLAAINRERWFPAHWVQGAWVGFDVALTLGLVALIFRWRQWLAGLLAGAITLDACLTLSEAIAWNAQRVRSVGDVLVLLLAVAGPTFSAVVMWNARSRHAVVAAGEGPPHPRAYAHRLRLAANNAPTTESSEVK